MMRNGIWSEEEHDRFLVAIKQYPQGPWAAIADAVGTRSVRQVQTHTQKYYEKIMRRMRGVRKERKTWARLEHRIEDDILEFCKIMHGSRAAAAAGSSASSSRSTSPGSSKPTSPSNTKMQSGGADMMLSGDVTIKLEEMANVALKVFRERMSDGCPTGSVVLVDVFGGSEFGETDSSSSEYSFDSQESQDSLKDDLEVISWDKLHAETAVTTTMDSEWLSFDDSVDYLIAFLAE